MKVEELNAFEKEWKHKILTSKEEYPALYNDEVKKNNYRLYGTIYSK
jgi:hypothetical protein